MSKETTNAKHTKWYLFNAKNAEKIMNKIKIEENKLPLTPENGKLLFGKGGVMRQLANATMTSHGGDFYFLFRNLLPPYQAMKLETLIDNLPQDNKNLDRFKNLAKLWVKHLNSIIVLFDKDTELKNQIEEEIKKTNSIRSMGYGIICGVDVGGGGAGVTEMTIAGSIARSLTSMSTGVGVYAAGMTIIAIVSITTSIKLYLEKRKTKEKLRLNSEDEYEVIMNTYRQLSEATSQIRQFIKIFRSHEIEFKKYISSANSFIVKCKIEAAKYKDLKEKKTENDEWFGRLKEKISNTAKNLTGVKKLDEQKLRFVDILGKLTMPAELDKMEIV
ncbi:MAG: hypothetical protein LBK29_01830 [Oscillospiraceae bacterium]|jgi:hypothetical protein|nr:hypothetical protein [Oscillospiraceae bacterium]